MPARLNRREAVGLFVGSALAARSTSAQEVNDVFLHGVASGDPNETSVVLWTRVETAGEVEPVRWQVAREPEFGAILAEGEAPAHADADHTVKVLAEGLEPGGIYHYRFMARGETSPVGRTRTLPSGSVSSLGIALASCSNFAFGHFNAYAAIADDPEIDLVLHTGDYIYEYGADGWGAETAREIGRVHEPAHEIVSLADYRQRHAQYKRDAGSKAMHAAHPLVCCWDDHESTNNPWTGGAQNHQADEGDWATRRQASIRAYYEWMPIREPSPYRTRKDFWRSYTFGDLATLVTLETRHTARGEQIDYGRHLAEIRNDADAEAFKRDVVGAPGRRMLSPAMERELSRSLRASVKARQPWRLLGNASPIARMLVPDLLGLGVLRDEGDGTSASLAWKARYNMPFYTDTWDGYPWAREQLYSLCRRVGASDLVVLTGDSHSFWANRLRDGEGRPMGVEIGTAGISSPGDFVESGFGSATAERLDRAFESELPEVRWTDNFHQGYVRVVLLPGQANVSYVAVDTVLEPSSKTRVLRTETVVRKGDSVDFA